MGRIFIGLLLSSKRWSKKFFHEPALYCRINIPVYVFYHRNVNKDIWIKYGLAITEKEYRIHVSRKEAIDIDTEEDFKLAVSVSTGQSFVIKKPNIYIYKNWEIITPEDADVNSFLEYIGLEKLEDTNYPILILENCKIPLTFLRIQDGSIRRYYLNLEAIKRIDNEKVQLTQNMKYIPSHYKQSNFYRPIRRVSNINHNLMLLHDMDGQLFGLDHRPIPFFRVYFMDEIKKQTFYKSPFIIK